METRRASKKSAEVQSSAAERSEDQENVAKEAQSVSGPSLSVPLPEEIEPVPPRAEKPEATEGGRMEPPAETRQGAAQAGRSEATRAQEAAGEAPTGAEARAQWEGISPPSLHDAVLDISSTLDNIRGSTVNSSSSKDNRGKTSARPCAFERPSMEYNVHRVETEPPADGPRQFDFANQMTQAVKGAMKEMCNAFIGVGDDLRESVKQMQELIPRAADGLEPVPVPHTISTRSAECGPGVREQDDTGIQRSRSRGRRGGIRRVSSETESDGEVSDVGSTRSESTIRRRHTNAKLPPFTGREQWKIWFARFEAVAKRSRWSEGDCLDELLPRLQGPAGEFVYGQLSETCRGQYKSLVKELNARFRVVETAKTFGAQFSNRNQKASETPEEYAAELKRLYDKAYIHRDVETRREDLLRKYLDGLCDDRARFHVEYVKEPKDIDEAVYNVVHFLETRRKPMKSEEHHRRPVRALNAVGDADSSDSEADGVDGSMIARLPTKAVKTGTGQSGQKDATVKEGGTKCSEVLQSLKDDIKQMCAELMKQNSAAGGRRNGPRVYTCYHCQEVGHLSRDCPAKKAGLPPTPRVASGSGVGVDSTVKKSLN